MKNKRAGFHIGIKEIMVIIITIAAIVIVAYILITKTKGLLP